MLGRLQHFNKVKKLVSTMTTDVKTAKVALVLSGSGVYDGSELHESSSCWVHLSRHGADVTMFAPDISQMHVIDHTSGQPMEEKRNVLKEAARLARGSITPLSGLDVAQFDALVVPGGFGAAKNLSSFAVDGPNLKMNPEMESVLKGFHRNKKPIALCCISGVLAAKCIPGVTVTVGHDTEEGGKYPYAGAAGAITQLGAKHVNMDVTQCCIDTENKVVTSPAFMYETQQVHLVHDGIGKMIEEVLKLI